METSQILGMVFFILFMLIAVASFGYSVYKNVNLVKDKRSTIDYKKHFKFIGILAGTFVVSFLAALLFIYLWNSYPASPREYASAIGGGILLGFSMFAFASSFIVYYYKKGLPDKLKQSLFVILMLSIPLVILSFFVTTDGFSDMGGPKFLFPKGISFTAGFVRPDSIEPANIAFYAICILAGAVFVYFLCDHYMYKEYGRHGTLDATFLCAFPSGIIGARIAYVIGNWTADGFDQRVAHGEWWSIFAIWEGGLTILGGAIAGIIVGVLVYIKTNKGRSIWKAVDLIVPTILIAQAVGRWGNFFNCEVHGGLVPETYWTWLPKFIFNNSHYSSASGNGWAPEGYLYAPLFFIEALVNMFGYFVIAHLFGKALKKITAPGDLCFGYVIWYGFTRVFMEPLRDASYNMGSDGYWSWMWSLIFVASGTLLIAINHIVRFILNNKKHLDSPYFVKSNFIGVGALTLVSVGLIVPGIIMMANNIGGLAIALNNFNIGVILLVTGVSILFLDSAICTELVYHLKSVKEHANA